jgi:hypothetical protein
MTCLTVVVKAKNPDELFSLLKSVDTVIKATDWSGTSEHSVEFVHREGEASVVITQDEETYHAAKINCCE